MRINGHVELMGQAQVKNFRPEILAADPAIGALFEGRGWWNTTDKSLKFFDGTSVITLAVGGDLSDYIRADGTVAMTGVLLLSSADQSGAAAEAAVSKGYVETLLTAKQATVTGAASTVVATDLTSNKAVVSDAQGKIVEGGATAAEIAHLSGVTSGVQAQIDGKQASLGYTPINKAGDSLDGDINANGHRLTGLAVPVAPTDAARQLDIDNALSGLNWQEDVKATQVDDTLDPGAVQLGDRYILTNVASLHAGFGTIAGVANGDIVEFDGTEFVVAFDVSAEGDKANGTLAWDNSSTSYKRFLSGAWGSFGGLSDINAGAGLEMVGNTMNVRMGAGIAELPEDGVGIDLRADSGLTLLNGAGEESTAADAKLTLKLDGTTLVKGANGLKVAAAGVTAAELAAAAFGNGLVGGEGSAVTVKAKAAGGIVVDADGVSVDSAKLGETFLAKTGGTAADLKVTAVPAADTDVVRLLELNAAASAAQTAANTVNTRLTNSEHVYDGLASVQTTHTVTHNLNNLYPQVEVMDADGSTVLVDSIVRVDANTVSVSVLPATGIRVVVRGNKN